MDLSSIREYPTPKDMIWERCLFRLVNASVSSTRSNKLVPPQIGGLVARQRLFREIERTPPRGVTWIAAPPGAGKSSLAATWLYSDRSAARHSHALWYCIDETDADLVIFFETLAVAVAELPDGPRDTLPRLTPEALPNLKTFARNWFKALLGNKARAPYLFVLDDVHRLPPDSLAVEVLAILAGALLARDRLLCLSRESPPDLFLSAVPRKRVAIISDLQVEADEWVDFERDVPGARGMTQATFATMAQRSGRWISDLVVAPALNSSLDDLRAHPSLTADRLLSSYSEADRAALLGTAFLQTGEEEEWRTLGGEGAVAVLTRLAGDSALVTRLLNSALRKHDLLFERFKAAAEMEMAPDALARARLATGRLLVARGEMLTGVRLLTQAGADDEARNLIVGQAPDMIASGRNQELVELIAMLPDSAQRSPLVRLWHSMGRLPFEPSSAREAFQDILRIANPAVQPIEFALAVIGDISAALADWSIDARLASIIDEIDRALPSLTALPEAVHERLMMNRAVAMMLGCPTHPDVLEAQRHIEAVLPRLPAGRQLLFGAILINYLLWWRGDLAAARPYLSSLAPLASRSDMSPLATMTWYYGALTVAYRDGDNDEVRRLMREVVAFAQKWGTQHRLANAYWVAAQAYAAAGDRAGTTAALEGCTEAATRSGRPDFVGAYFLRAAIALGAGDADLAIGEVTPGYERAGRVGDTQERGMSGVLLAMAFAVKGDDTARAHIDELRDLAARSHSAIFRLHAGLANACLAAEQGRMVEFVTAWNGTAHLACQLGFRRISGMNAAYLGYLANEALRRGVEIDATRRLITLWSLPPPRRAVVDDLWPYRVSIESLGGFAIRVEDSLIATGQTKAQRKPLELLFHLIAANGRHLGQDWLADELWPDAEGDQSLHSLTTTIYRLRKLIGADAIIHEDTHVRLNPLRVSTDLDRFHATLGRVQDEALPTADRMAAFDRALQLYRGPLLPGVALAPVVVERDRLSVLLASEGLGFLLTLDPGDLGRALRLNRLRSAIGDTVLPDSVARLWPA
jgi:LuxR family transcriptional regulator, maltose regulon positive regulatory protein